jgi:hypothetical protein
MTVKELKEILENIEEDKKIYIACAHGYTTNFVVENTLYHVYVMDETENDS